MSALPPGELPDQSGFLAKSSGNITPKPNEPTEIKIEPSEPTLSETISQSNNMQQIEEVSTDNPKESEAKSVLVSQQGFPNINDGKLASGDFMANTTGKVSPEAKLCEIEKEVKNLNISVGQSNLPSKVVVKNKTESLKNLMAYAASSDSEGEEVCMYKYYSYLVLHIVEHIVSTIVSTVVNLILKIWEYY